MRATRSEETPLTQDLTTTPLNPAQREIQETLGASAEQRPTFRDDLRDDLRSQLEHSFFELLHDEIQLPIFLSKHGLNLLHGCEARFMAEQDDEFEWSIPMARGTVTHKAIELHIGRRGNHTPIDLVEDAISRLENEERSISGFLRELIESDRAQLVADSNEVVAAFFETFPPIKRRWVPVCESRVRSDFCDDNITLAGKIDLTLGQAKGMTAGKVIFDLKTGRSHPSHTDDLRFYALVETLKVGTPPRLLVNYYLESGTPRYEAVTEDLLFITARRVIDGVRKYIELNQTNPRPAEFTPGMNCRWCPINESCEAGQRELNRQAEEYDEL